MVIKDIKPRAIYVYPPGQDQADKWKKLAKEAKVSISRFVIDHVENSLAQEAQEKYEARAELRRKIKEVEEEARDLRRQNRILEHAVDKLEKENRTYRQREWKSPAQPGSRTFEKELIQILREEGPVTDQQILKHLGIEPSDLDSVDSVSNQLTELQAWGLTRPTKKGWTWTTPGGREE